MRVIVWYKGGSFYEVQISPEVAKTLRGPVDAIAEAKKILQPAQLKDAVRWEVEEEFL